MNEKPKSKFQSPSFIKLIRGKILDELLVREDERGAFVLLTIIAKRANFTGSVNDKGLQPFEAFVGDLSKYGLSRGCTRGATRWLKNRGLITTRKTSDLTSRNGRSIIVAKLLTQEVYDLSNNANSGLDNQSANHTDKKSANHTLTSRKPVTNHKQEDFNKRAEKKIEKEKTTTARARDDFFPSFSIWLAEAKRIGWTGEDPKNVWKQFESSGWVDQKGKPIRSWKAIMPGFKKQRAKHEPTDEDRKEPNGHDRGEDGVCITSSTKPKTTIYNLSKVLDVVNSQIREIDKERERMGSLGISDRKKLKDLRLKKKGLEDQLLDLIEPGEKVTEKPESNRKPVMEENTEMKMQREMRRRDEYDADLKARNAKIREANERTEKNKEMDPAKMLGLRFH
jgi:hypothetical protein